MTTATPIDEPTTLLRAGLASMSAGGKPLRVEDVQEAFVEQKECLLTAIDATKTILSDLRDFNKNDWVVRYPQLRPIPPPSTSDAPQPKSSRQRPRRSMTFADDPSTETEVIISKQGLSRSVTLAALSEIEPSQSPSASTSLPTLSELDISDEPETDSDSLLNVIRLDLNIGRSVSSLVSHLEKSSIANLLDSRLSAASSHLASLRNRVLDTSSKVLVTGDLNAGKSTFVNALLRREVLPIDQQPCTAAFCEVRDAQENQGVEEVHVCKEGATYNVNDENTFERKSLDDLESLATETTSLLKVYLADSRGPSESLLNNGIVDIALIDAPGLNRDSLKTTALFSQQPEIDVVVFVVSAENHFTLSAKEFLWESAREKKYVFVVVNKFGGIRDKAKCRRIIEEQVKGVSPGTWEERGDLVHFVDSKSALAPTGEANPDFDDLEAALRSFVLVKRSKSKMQPVRTYLDNLLGDVEVLAGANGIVAKDEMEKAIRELDEKRPVVKKLLDGRTEMEEELELIEDDGVKATSTRTEQLLKHALDRISQGKLAVDTGFKGLQMPSYPGVWGVWEYARAVRKAMLLSLDSVVATAEDEARGITSESVRRAGDVGDKWLPEGADKGRRVFMPEAMFRVGKKDVVKGRKRNTVVVGGIHGLGLGLAQREDMLETTLEDVLDFRHRFYLYFGHHDDSKSAGSDEKEGDGNMTALSVLGVSLGTVSMVGGQLGLGSVVGLGLGGGITGIFGLRSAIEGAARFVEVVSDEKVQRWIAPVVGAVALGAVGWVIIELPHTVPRSVGRRVRESVENDWRMKKEMKRVQEKRRKDLSSSSSPTSNPITSLISSNSLVVAEEAEDNTNVFVAFNKERIEREVRKVLRLAGWDVRERFREAVEKRVTEVKNMEEAERRASKASEVCGSVEERCRGVREGMFHGFTASS
ncbi:hypothetical protein ONZ45_g295 [Pleurotus djamor]|nr:hypothetical protein ONZ45_g295 [Pleurotus djamor]